MIVKTKVQTQERGLCHLHHMLVVEDIWISYTLTEWQFAIMLGSLTYLLPLRAIQIGLKFNVCVIQ